MYIIVTHFKLHLSKIITYLVEWIKDVCLRLNLLTNSTYESYIKDTVIFENCE